MQQDPTIVHPLPLETKVTAKQATCPCHGGGNKIITGTISKVINNRTVYWYYLGDLGITIKQDSIISLA